MQPAASPPVTLTYGSSLVWDRVKPGTTRGSIAYLGNFRQLDECKQKCLGHATRCWAFTFHDVAIKNPPFAGECFGLTSPPAGSRRPARFGALLRRAASATSSGRAAP